jgi:ribosomal protein L28
MISYFIMPCYYCEKTIVFGRTHTHHRGVAGGRWKKRAPKKQKIFEPNLQPIHILIEGRNERVKLCTKCIKRINKDVKEGVKPFLTLAKLQGKEKLKN